MEARKRGTPRDAAGEYDVESNHHGGSEDIVGATPYSALAKEPSSAAPTGKIAADGLVAVAGGAPAREDSHIRSLSKGLTWRFIASGTTIVIAKIVTGETAIAFQIGFFEFFAKIMIYYVHERIWARIRL